MKITKIKAREILDSRGNPTVECDVFVKDNKFTAAVPAGASTGTYEAVELRDKDDRYLGKGVRKAVRNIEKVIAKKVIGMDCTQQREIDNLMIHLDHTENKSKLGANAILAVSLAVARAGAHTKNLELYEYISQLSNRKFNLPKPFFNIINGGKHAGNKLPLQEFMISPNEKKFKENLRIASETYHHLQRIIEKEYGKQAIAVGDEGGFAPPIKRAEEALTLLKKAIRKSGKEIDIAMDCAASEFYVRKGSFYQLHRKFSKEKLTEYYLELIKKFKIYSMEDPFDEEDFESFAKLREKLGIQIVGDDLTVTNKERIEAALLEKSCNCLLLKVNQIGTLTEALEAAKLAFDNKWEVMVSHRSGETEDTFIADLAVGLGAMIKAGAPCRGERTAKYNRLLRIEER